MGRALIVPASFLVLLLNSCYVTTQGYHLMRHQLAARPVERLQRNAVRDVSLSAGMEEEQRLFRDVDRIRTYGIEQVRLTAGKSFTTYVRTDRDYLVDVVSAAREDRFERKEWRFPIFGAFPYKGFYRTEPAMRLAAQLRREGWDVYVRRVDAFSTLGFFRDPLYSFMAGYEEARLADLVLHEMAHATLWIRDEAQFNEEFATFVGRTGARDYLVERYGPEDPRVLDLEMQRLDNDTFREDMLRLRDQLQELYESVRDLEDGYSRRERILREKEATIAAFQREFAATYHDRYRSERFLAGAEITINNAYLDLFSTYTGNLHLFEEYHHLLGGTLGETTEALVYLMTNRPGGERPTATLRRTLEELRESRNVPDRATLPGEDQT